MATPKCPVCYDLKMIITVCDIATGYTEAEPCPICSPEDVMARSHTLCLKCETYRPDCEPVRVDDGSLIGCMQMESWCGVCRAAVTLTLDEQSEAA